MNNYGNGDDDRRTATASARVPGRLTPKWKIMLGALLGVVILAVVLHLVREMRWHIEVMNPGAPARWSPTEPTLDQLLERLADERKSTRETAIAKLVEYGERAIEPLMNVLRSGDKRARGGARQALAGIGEPAVADLLDALAEDDSLVVAAAAWALGEIGNARAVHPLIREFAAHVAFDPAESYPLPDDMGIDEFSAAIEAERERARDNEDATVAIAEALGKLRAIESVHGLTAGATRQNSLRNRAIASALLNMGEDAIEPLNDALWQLGPEGRALAAQVLARLDAEGTSEDLVRLLDSQDPAVRVAAARSLVAAEDSRGLPVLVEVIEADLFDLRMQAVQLLGELGDPQGAPVLIKTLDHEEQPMRVAAAAALGLVGDRSAVEPLIAVLDRDPLTDHLTVAAAAEALGLLGDKRAVEPLRQTLDYGDPVVEANAVAALAAISGPDTIPMLIDQLAEGYAMSGNEARRTLISMGKTATPALVQALSDERSQVQHQARQALLDMGDVALDALISGLETAKGEARDSIIYLLRPLVPKHPRAQEAIDRALTAADDG